MENNWTVDQCQTFLNQYQTIHFKENKANSYVKCQYKRQAIHYLIEGAKETTSNETTCLILKRKLQEYSAVVDKRDDVNNYASGVLSLLPHNSNDVQKWRSNASATDLLQEFLKPVPGECFHQTPAGCAARKPSDMEIEHFFKNKKGFPPSLNSNIVRKAPVPATNKRGLTNMNQPSTSFSENLQRKSDHVKNRVQQEPCRVMNSIQSRVFGTSQPMNQHQKNSLQTTAQNMPSFRTAGTELKLQNMKKYGQQGPSAGYGESASYGATKKSLGGRSRSVNSRFVPPIKSNSQDDMDSQPNSCEEEVGDERLRLTDPKLVELIRSEIMDLGPPVHWDDIAGLHFAKATIQEAVVLPMLRPDIFTGLRRPPKGILLFGPPGTGKTLIGKCIASQSKSTFFNISASSLTSKWVGEGEKMVRTLFTLARVHQPAVVFIDEIDSLLSQRSETEHESSRRIKTEFLVQVDGAGTGEDDRILVIGATNRPQELDEAARRRLVKRLYIPLPDAKARCQIVQNLMSSERNNLTQQQMEEVGALTEGFSGADMKVVCQEASLGPIRALTFTEMQHITPDQVRPVTLEDFKAALAVVRSSVSSKDLESYISWDRTYGSGGAPK